MNISAFDIRERFEKLADKQVVYSFFGSLETDQLNAILSELELFLNGNIERRTIRKKMFHIFVEITQNLHNHFDGNTELNGHNEFFILVKEIEEGYTIVTGNYLFSKHVPGIRTRIEMVNAMSDKELKDLYRGILNFGGVTDGGGAGLGFIDLARKSGEKLAYKFEEIDNKFSFFTLEVQLLTDIKNN